MRIAGILLYRLLKELPGRINAPEVEQRDALIHLRDLGFGIERGSLFKRLQRFFEELLVHVGSAGIVETSRFSRLIRLLRSRRVLRSCCEDSNRGQNDAGTNEGNRLSHAKNK